MVLEETAEPIERTTGSEGGLEDDGKRVNCRCRVVP
jgi:hypothetical protein